MWTSVWRFSAARLERMRSRGSGPERRIGQIIMALKPLQENGVTRSSGGCLDTELLASYVDGRTTPEQRVEVEAHLARCEDCYFAFSETVQEQKAEGTASEESEPASAGVDGCRGPPPASPPRRPWSSPCRCRRPAGPVATPEA